MPMDCNQLSFAALWLRAMGTLYSVELNFSVMMTNFGMETTERVIEELF